MGTGSEEHQVNVIEAAGLGKRYGRAWALRDCTLSVPAGQVTGLVGPNGAGKTTLLSLAVGLARPTAGTVTVAGGERAGSPAARDKIAFVAQDAPLYAGLPVRDMLKVARNLNRRWDGDRAVGRLAELGIPLRARVGALSGGQKAQLALTIALARRPQLLVLDEPLAALDPVARQDFTRSLLAAVAEDQISAVFSTHVVAELEEVAGYLIVLGRGQVLLSGRAAGLTASHGGQSLAKVILSTLRGHAAGQETEAAA
jgi:ABC-2 type transport system ATP-binding protein